MHGTNKLTVLLGRASEMQREKTRKHRERGKRWVELMWIYKFHENGEFEYLISMVDNIFGEEKKRRKEERVYEKQGLK